MASGSSTTPEDFGSVSPGTSSRIAGDTVSPEQRPTSQQRSSSDYRIVRKRNRIPLSCGPCRNRKLKCNRASPCDNCVRRKDVSSCTYATSTASRARPRERGGQSDEMQSRIDRLEGLVLSLMQSGAAPSAGQVVSERSGSMTESIGAMTGSVDDEHDQDPEEMIDDGDEMEKVNHAFGILKFDGEKSYYRGESYWAAILNEIQGMKKAFDESKTQIELELEKHAQSGCPQEAPAIRRTAPFATALGREELLAMIPVKGLVDLLVDAYFRNFDPLFHILHRPTFTRQMEVFYTDQASVDTSWLALLFVVLSVALRIYHHSGEEPEALAGQALPMAYVLRSAGEAALGAAQFVKKPVPHTLQAIYLLCLFPGEGDKADYLWPIMAMGIRMAFSMGLHREIAYTPKKELSPREAEIRRRIWAQLTTTDLALSVQMGLPAMIRESEYDTKPPLNLHDDEIPENGPLPSPRPKEEMTEASFLIHHNAFITLYARAAETVQAAGRNFSYSEMQRLKCSVTDMRSALPSFLKLQSIEACFANNDPVWLIIQRYTLDTLYQKTILLLHRPFTYRCARDRSHIHSARVQCVDASMQLLKHHATLSSGHPGLAHGRWFLVAQRPNDYLQAVMILCLHLAVTASEARQRQQQQSQRHFSSSSASSTSNSIATPTSTNSPSSFSTTSAASPGHSDATIDHTHSRESIYRALHIFRAIFARSDSSDFEKAKAVLILNLMFEKLSIEDPDFPDCCSKRDGCRDPDDEIWEAAEKAGFAGWNSIPSATANDNPAAPDSNAAAAIGNTGPFSPGFLGLLDPKQNSVGSPLSMNLGMDDIQGWIPWGTPGWEEWDELMRGVEFGGTANTTTMVPTSPGWSSGFVPGGGAGAGGGPPWMVGNGPLYGETGNAEEKKARK